MPTTLFVVLRILANPLSNVFQKQLAGRSADPLFIIGATHALLTLVCLPVALARLEVRDSLGFWVNIVISALLAVAGNALIVYALRRSDLSVLGPINAYKAVVGLVLGIFLIGEIPSAMGTAGVMLIVAGSYFVMDRAQGNAAGSAFARFFRERGVQLRFAALVVSATEAIFLKKALLHATPLSAFLVWSILGAPIAALAIALLTPGKLGEQVATLKANAGTYLLLAATTGTMQLATLLTFGELQVGYSLALFQTSAIVSVILGYHYFRERDFRRRLLGSVVMVVGAALIVATS